MATQQTFVLLKTYWIRLQCNIFLSFKTSWRRLEDITARPLANTSWRRLGRRKVLRWRRLQDVLKTSWKTRNVCWESTDNRQQVNINVYLRCFAIIIVQENILILFETLTFALTFIFYVFFCTPLSLILFPSSGFW